MSSTGIHLRVLLPSGVFLEEANVRRVIAETHEGLFGVLPRRLDCAAALVPGILTYESDTGRESFVAVDEGVLLKTASTVTVAVRNASSGAGLGDLRQAVESLYGELNEREHDMRSVLNKLESHFIRQLMEFGHEQKS